MENKLNKNEKNISIGSFLAKFFIVIGFGGLFLSVGIVGSYRLYHNLSVSMPSAAIIVSLLIGIFLDGLAISYFFKNREKFIKELFKEDK